jgi:hypothetical protein
MMIDDWLSIETALLCRVSFYSIRPTNWKCRNGSECLKLMYSIDFRGQMLKAQGIRLRAEKSVRQPSWLPRLSASQLLSGCRFNPQSAICNPQLDRSAIRSSILIAQHCIQIAGLPASEPPRLPAFLPPSALRIRPSDFRIPNSAFFRLPAACRARLSGAAAAAGAPADDLRESIRPKALEASSRRPAKIEFVRRADRAAVS